MVILTEYQISTVIHGRSFPFRCTRSLIFVLVSFLLFGLDEYFWKQTFHGFVIEKQVEGAI